MVDQYNQESLGMKPVLEIWIFASLSWRTLISEISQTFAGLRTGIRNPRLL